MAFSIQPLADDSKFSHALRCEALEQVCPRDLVSELLTRGAFFRFGLRLMAIDGTLDEVADTAANALYFGHRSLGKHIRPFPQVRCLYLAEVGNHAIDDGVFAPWRVAEQRIAPVVLCSRPMPGAPQGSPVHPGAGTL